MKMDFENVMVETGCGVVRGVKTDGFFAFKGIPYAQAKRFMPPQAVCWDGVLDGSVFGKKAMQVYDGASPWMKPQSREDFDEDCLNLNIYVPVCAADDACGGLPVLLEIHGGAYQTGSNREHTPQAMVKDRPVIYVSVNYRLGVWGFLHLGEQLGEKYAASGNNGILDLLAGVRWIYQNIEAFGGNRDKITVLGGSAGAKAIGALMMMPEFDRYVSQVIMSSGATQSIRSLSTAVKTTERFLETAGGVRAEELLLISSDELLAIQKRFCDNPGNTCMFGPVADGKLLPEDWEPVAAAGTLWHGRAMIGCSHHELMFYAMFNPDFDQTAPAVAEALFGKNAKIAEEDFKQFVEDYVNQNNCQPDTQTIKNAWAQIITDYMYRMYSYKLARRLAKKGCRVWQYHVELLPALHCFDQTLAFSADLGMFCRDDAEKAAAAAVGTQIFLSFLDFVEFGDPAKNFAGWQPLDEAHPRQMCWNIHSEVKDIEPDEVYDRFPESVYIL